jgi:hypothetical protein
LSLWETTPAERFSDAHLLGNGRLGATVYGTIPDERILINEDTLWSGSEHRHANPGARAHLEQARKLVFEAKYREATDLVEAKMLGAWGQAYQPLGNLWISTDQGDPTTNEQVRRMGGFEVSAEWQDRRLTRATVTSHAGKTCRVKPGGLTQVTSAGAALRDVRVGPGWIEFETEPGQTYELAGEGGQ